MTPQLLQFVEKHWMLCVAFFLVLALIIFEEMRKSIRPAMSLLPQEVVNLVNHEEALIIDIRDNTAFKNGHILHSMNMSKSEWQRHEKKLLQFKEKNIVIVAVTEEEAKKVAQQLKTQGFTKVFVLAAGINAWQRANLPLIKNK